MVSQYQSKIQDAKRYGLIKETFDFKAVIDDRFLKQALRELNLENYWKPVDAAGKPQELTSSCSKRCIPIGRFGGLLT